MREVVDSKLIFYKNYNLLIYSKSTIIAFKASKSLSKAIVKELNSSNSSKSFSKDKILDIKKV